MSKLRHLRALQVFDTVASLSSLTRAADLLGVSHGAVSKQIAQLEEYLGVLLLHRQARGVSMTDAGKQLHLATQQGFEALTLGVRSVRRQPKRKSVTISLSSSLATKWLVPRLPAFRAKYPGTAMFLDTNDDVIDFEDYQIDVALRFGVPGPGWGGLYHELIADEALIVVASPALVAAKALPMSPSEIVRLPLLHDHFNPAWDNWADQTGIAQSHLGTQDLMFTDTAVLIAAAIDGQGVALVRRLLVEDDLAAGRVVRLDKSVVGTERSLYFVCRQGDQDHVSIRSFRNWLRDVQGSS